MCGGRRGCAEGRPAGNPPAEQARAARGPPPGGLPGPRYHGHRETEEEEESREIKRGEIEEES